ncbi:MAG: PseG/SpsG family protein [Betaproteobacteria bacterium]
MKAFFYADAGARTGLGHFRRSVALARRLTESLSVCFAIQERALAERLGEVRPVLIRDPGLDWGSLEAALERHKPDLLVLDSYRLDSAVLARLRRHALTMALIADLPGDYSLADVVVDPTGAATEDGGTPGGPLCLSGPSFALLGPEFGGHFKRTIRPRVRTILVTVGGSDPRTVTPALVEEADAVLAGRGRIIVVLGPFFAQTAEVRRIAAQAATRVDLADNPADLCGLMAASDLAVTGGGQTLFELAAMGLPAVAIEIAENQRKNIDTFVAAGAVVSAGPASGGSLRVWLRQALAELAGDARRRLAMSEAGRAVVDGRGTERVARVLVELLKEGRREW